MMHEFAIRKRPQNKWPDHPQHPRALVIEPRAGAKESIGCPPVPILYSTRMKAYLPH